MGAAGTDRGHRLVDTVRAGVRFRCTTHRDDERLGAGDDVAPHALGHPPAGIQCHGLVPKDRLAQVAPVNALGGRAPWLLFRCWLLVSYRLRPNDRHTVAARHQIKAFADSRRPGVRRDALPPFDVVAQSAYQGFLRNELTNGLLNLRHVRMIHRQSSAERRDERLEGAPAFGLDWLAALVDWPPVAELFDVLQEHQAGAGGVCPANNNPGKSTHTTVTRCAALGLAVVAAVRRGPENADWLPAGGQHRINLEHICNVVGGLGVIGAVYGQGNWVVVYRHVGLPVCPGNAGARAAAAGKQVHHQFFLERQAHAWLAMDEMVFLLLCGHRGTSPV